MPRSDLRTAPTLAVASGQRVVLSTSGRPQHGRVTRLRPLTVAALRTLTPTAPARRGRMGAARARAQPLARLSDPTAFDEPSTVNGLVDVRVFATPGRLGGHSSRVVRAMIHHLEPGDAVPSHVWLPIETPSARQHELTMQLPVPSEIQHLSFVSVGLAFSNIWLGPDATLVIGEDTSHLLCLNFFAHQTAHVVQDAPHVVLDVLGSLAGGAHLTAQTGPEEFVAKIPTDPLQFADLPALGLQLIPPGL